jgi:hypothetical protein
MASLENLGNQSIETPTLYPNAFRCQQLRVVGNLASKLPVGEFVDPRSSRELSIVRFGDGIQIRLDKNGREYGTSFHKVIDVTYGQDMFDPPYVKAETQTYRITGYTVTSFDANSWNDSSLSPLEIAISLIGARRLIKKSKKS